MVIAHFPVNQSKFKNTEKMQPETNDDHPGDLGKKFSIGQDKLADKTGTRPQHDKNSGKPHHKQARRQHHAARQGRVFLVPVFQLLQRGAGKKTQIWRHQRQHTRRQKTQYPGK